MANAQRVPVGPAIAGSVLYHLIGEPILIFPDVPVADGALDRAASKRPQTLQLFEEEEEGGTRPADRGNRVQCSRLDGRLAVSDRQRKGEDRVILLHRKSVLRNLDDTPNRALAVLKQACAQRGFAALGMLLRARVVRSLGSAENQEAIQSRPVIDGKDCTPPGGASPFPTLPAVQRLRLPEPAS